jgi:hypothetical protein
MQYTSKLYILFAVLFVACSTACQKELKLPAIGGEKKIVLIGEFVAGDTFYLRAGQSIPVSSNEKKGFQLLEDLSVKLSEGNNKYNLISYVDEYASILYTYPFSNAQIAVAGNTYHIEATHTNLGTATAEIYIPRQIDAKVTDTLSGRYNNDSVIKVRIRITDPVGSANYYVIEALKQKLTIVGNDTTYHREYSRNALYTADKNSENVLDNGASTQNKRILLKDSRFNGSVYETDVYVLRTILTYGSETLKGRSIIRIKSVSEPYFRFLKAYEVYEPAIGFNTFEQPVKIEGNVNGGLGMIGGVSQVDHVLSYDP